MPVPLSDVSRIIRTYYRNHTFTALSAQFLCTFNVPSFIPIFWNFVDVLCLVFYQSFLLGLLSAVFAQSSISRSCSVLLSLLSAVPAQSCSVVYQSFLLGLLSAILARYSISCSCSVFYQPFLLSLLSVILARSSISHSCSVFYQLFLLSLLSAVPAQSCSVVYQSFLLGLLAVLARSSISRSCSVSHCGCLSPSGNLGHHSILLAYILLFSRAVAIAISPLLFLL